MCRYISAPLERYESSQLRLKEDDGKTIQLFLTLIRNLLLGAEKRKGSSELSNQSELKVRGLGYIITSTRARSFCIARG